jgi:hypothetical protein
MADPGGRATRGLAPARPAEAEIICVAVHRDRGLAAVLTVIRLICTLNCRDRASRAWVWQTRVSVPPRCPASFHPPPNVACTRPSCHTRVHNHLRGLPGVRPGSVSPCSAAATPRLFVFGASRPPAALSTAAARSKCGTTAATAPSATDACSWCIPTLLHQPLLAAALLLCKQLRAAGRQCQRRRHQWPP